MKTVYSESMQTKSIFPEKYKTLHTTWSKNQLKICKTDRVQDFRNFSKIAIFTKPTVSRSISLRDP
ncbi:hypothetical protein CAEBREN_11746 [Caenorhabditis brenneri]|uniref:Uncharacterized protein n=1 Tax=Caenorhabditis brenneri TaxID=135651 RepID=G0N2Z8_CAEBE|nr:hypothetical protein CAEBREN_11746 [Caenorhabditis brenneri]